ncbi:hypothetical protein [Nocardia sp. alder85J]|uniref:hypothetical protein n=1 Tax=Nocardia sp. alder85J TaxID=2862949 RepID=UPI001CD53324|nr:hypothetical protein [Nocardia sp. alder85J]MCX4098889.1 hypothetical protein [Nocardia sp. alder85J]
MASGRVCVVYHYYEADSTYRENLLHFLVFGIVPEVEYFIVIAGSVTPELPQAPNIHYVFAPNVNRDYGGYSFALKRVVPVGRYDHFVFVNSSVRGPYLRAADGRPWYEALLGLIRDDVALAGATINILPPTSWFARTFVERHGGPPRCSHVQSMVFALPRARLIELLAAGFFDAGGVPVDRATLIVDYEILLSQRLIRDGWNIRCLLPEYNTVDYRRHHADVNPTSAEGDPCMPDAYFGRTIHPFESMFVKTNRNIYPPGYLAGVTRAMVAVRSLLGPRPWSDSLTGYVEDTMRQVGSSLV